MIDGVYTLTVTDLKDCVHFEDGIAACNYDIDIHNPEAPARAIITSKRARITPFPIEA